VAVDLTLAVLESEVSEVEAMVDLVFQDLMQPPTPVAVEVAVAMQTLEVTAAQVLSLSGTTHRVK
jgi:hypothetical protein